VALLKPTATVAEIEALAAVLRQEGFSFMCVNSFHTATAARSLKGSNVKVVTCVGFPQGAVKTDTKVFETEAAAAEGAGDIDMVLNLGAFLGGDLKLAEADIRAVVRAAKGLPVKVIIETPFLTMQQKIDASRVVQAGGASFVKTCTGTSPDPIALFEDIRLIRQTIGPTMGIKASGRVGNWFRFQTMMEAGATRIGLVLEQAREILRGRQEDSGGAA
jgi:deoxyribose-phosphate aldolase